MVSSGSRLASAPFVRLLFPLCIGVSIPLTTFFSSLLQNLVLFPLFLLVLYVLKEVSFSKQHLWSTILFFAIFYFGIIRLKQETIIFPNLLNQEYFVVLEDYPSEKEKTYQVVAKLIEKEHKILIYFPKQPEVKSAKPGDILRFNGLPELIQNEGNPFEFDYKSYLNNKGIGYRIFLKGDQFSFINGLARLRIYHRALLFRAKLIASLDRSGIRSDVVHLIASISFGAREEVDKEVIQSFTNTGVIHVLAVSGMNVGLIFVILDFLLRFLKSRRIGFFLHTFLILSAIWAYTLMTGMSASILRAAIMFSFVIIGNALNRNSNIFNSLAVSAFVLIAWDPFIIRDVGFQLSYAAVLSIVVIQPMIYKQLYFKNWLLNQIWLLVSVTFAAQIGTIPFTLHYFHQFPVYFWLANLMVIPLVTLILYLSFVVVFLSLISVYLTSILAFVLEWSVRLVLMIVKNVEALPHSVIRGLYPSLFHVLLVFLIGFFIYRYAKLKKIILLQSIFILMILLSVSVGIVSYRQQNMAEIVFFNISGTRALALLHSKEVIVLYDRCENASVKLGYILKPYIGERGIKRIGMYQLTDSLKLDSKNISVRGNFIFFGNVRLFIQPIIDKDIKIANPILYTDLIWLRKLRIEKTNKDAFLKTKNILYLSSESRNIEWLRNASVNSFKMNKAVHLIIPPTLSWKPDKLHFSYFN